MKKITLPAIALALSMLASCNWLGSREQETSVETADSATVVEEIQDTVVGQDTASENFQEICLDE